MDTITTIKEVYELTKGESVYELVTEGGRVMKVEYQVHKFVHPVSISQLDDALQALSDQTEKIAALKVEVQGKEAEIVAESAIITE